MGLKLPLESRFSALKRRRPVAQNGSCFQVYDIRLTARDHAEEETHFHA